MFKIVSGMDSVNLKIENAICLITLATARHKENEIFQLGHNNNSNLTPYVMLNKKHCCIRM